MENQEKKIEVLKKILDESNYTVVIGGSGMMEECGYKGIKTPERAYEIERRYGISPEDIFTSVFYNNRTAQFFEFYRNEMLMNPPEPTESAYAAAKMEQAGKLQCIIDGNIFEQPQRGGCRNVIPLHGSIYRNACPHCRKTYSMEYVRDSGKIPRCEDCGRVIRPGVMFFGEMMDSTLMSEATRQIESAEVLLLLGTSMDSDVFSKYVKYFDGGKLVIIHKNHHDLDEKADLVILDEPKILLSKLGY